MDGPTLAFGTDGVRGVAGEGVMTPDGIERLGVALADWLGSKDLGGPVLIGGDTRESTPWLTEALARGLAQREIASIDLGVLPTAALALLLPEYGATCAAVISASHNPAAHNGIKVFGGESKLDDASANWIESRWREVSAIGGQDGGSLLRRDGDGGERFLRRLLGTVQGLSLAGRRVALDLSHGAAHHVAPELLRRLGAEIECLGDRPDGRNINLECGSQHPEHLQELVRRGSFDFGLAVDGDADRSVFVDEHGSVVDGDGVLAAVASDLAERGLLPGDTVVGTVMSNFGLERFLAQRGLHLERTAVGDRHISARLREGGFAIGGEPSGHVIFGDELGFLGDGLYTTLRLAELMVRRGISLSSAISGLELLPQVLLGVRVRARPPLEELSSFSSHLSAAEQELDGRGRVVVRYSGTEPLLRVMVEGEDAGRVREIAQDLATAAEREIASL